MIKLVRIDYRLLHGQVEQLCREFEKKRNGTR